MNHKLTPSTILMLVTAPLLWAGNAIVGRILYPLVPPITLNFFRWAIACVVLSIFGAWVFRRDSGMWPHWRRFALLGLLGVGMYNAMQYLALHSSTPINVTLVGSSMPAWMLAIGWLFFSAHVSRRQVVGAVLSIAGVLIVLSHGEWERLLAFRLVPGDLYMIVATIVWSFYSWLLVRPQEPETIRRDWAAFLLAQVAFGTVWSGVFAAGEWALTDARIHWSGTLVAGILYVAIGPAIIAFRCWGAGVQRVGPSIASFFNNLTPLFAAVMSSAFLGEMPHLYHAIAFLLIVCGIVLSARR